MARKIAELFVLNRGVRPFYAACCFDELSRGSFSCLLNASFKTAVSHRHNSIFWAKIDDHGIHRGDTGQILIQWHHMVASTVDLDLPYWAMCTALYRLIRMLWSIKNEALLYYCSLLCINLVSILWRPANSNECPFGYHCQLRASNCCQLTERQWK